MLALKKHFCFLYKAIEFSIKKSQIHKTKSFIIIIENSNIDISFSYFLFLNILSRLKPTKPKPERKDYFLMKLYIIDYINKTVEFIFQWLF